VRRWRIDADDFAVAVIALAVMLGCCTGAHASEPLHSFGPPSPASWSVTAGGPQRLGIVLSPDTWETALERSELLRVVEAERDAALEALAAERDVSASLLDELRASRKQVESLRVSLEMSRASEFRVEKRSRRRGAGIAWGLALGVLAGAAVSR
jgi:hypothetical protein